MSNKFYSMLGLCMRAGKLAYGSDMCEEKIKYNKISLLIVANDAAENTRNKFERICGEDVLYRVFGTIDEISRAIGKNNKAVIGIMDDGFGKKIDELMSESIKGGK